MLDVQDISDHKLESFAMTGGSMNWPLQVRGALSVALQVRLVVTRKDLVYQLWNMNILWAI